MDALTNNKETKPMSVGQASAIITGCGVGGGVMSLPYLVNKIGIGMALLVLFIALVITCFLNIMFADLAIKNGCEGQTTDIVKNLVLKGKIKKIGSFILFLFLSVQIIASLGAYINGAGEIICKLFFRVQESSPNYTGCLIAGKIIFFIIAAVLIFFSLKVLGVVEQWAIYIMYASLLALIIGSCIKASHPLPTHIGSVQNIFAFYGISMLALNSFHSVPQVVTGLKGDAKKIKKSIIYGTILNFAIILVISIFSLISSKEVTKNVIIGWSAGIGNWAEIVGSIFSLFAFLTSFWALSFALRDIFKQQFNVSVKIALLFATIPSLILALIPIGNFSLFIDINSSLVGIIIAIFVIPGFWYQRNINNNESILGKLGSAPFCIITMLGYVMMGVGSIIALI